MTTVSTSRDLLEAIGIGHFNSTMMIQDMMVAPAVTDPKSPQIILMVRAVQKALFDLGASDVHNSGRLDQATAAALERVVGHGWERSSWGANIQAIVNAKKMGTRLDVPVHDDLDVGMPIAISGPLDFLPDLPGGLFTYAVLGYFTYRYFKGKS
jgi:hypothetical protein